VIFSSTKGHDSFVRGLSSCGDEFCDGGGTDKSDCFDSGVIANCFDNYRTLELSEEVSTFFITVDEIEASVPTLDGL
jgi:hypothetical protein